MGVECTFFSVLESDIPQATEPPQETSDLLRYYDDEGALMEQLEENPALNLGKAWDAVHFSLGAHEDDHPLAFIESGGEDIPALGDGEMSHGRYFDAPGVVRIREAVLALPEVDLARNFAKRDQVEDPDSLYPTGLRPFDVEDVLYEVKRIRVFLDEVTVAKRGLIVHIAGWLLASHLNRGFSALYNYLSRSVREEMRKRYNRVTFTFNVLGIHRDRSLVRQLRDGVRQALRNSLGLNEPNHRWLLHWLHMTTPERLHHELSSDDLPDVIEVAESLKAAQNDLSARWAIFRMRSDLVHAVK